ncbi:hypothetical protein SNEBB_009817 [Seison nebaliae]|nr:hypothetical protein SNEBB_009817 [Seison nebaliae]
MNMNKIILDWERRNPFYELVDDHLQDFNMKLYPPVLYSRNLIVYDQLRYFTTPVDDKNEMLEEKIFDDSYKTSNKPAKIKLVSSPVSITSQEKRRMPPLVKEKPKPEKAVLWYVNQPLLQFVDDGCLEWFDPQRINEINDETDNDATDFGVVHPMESKPNEDILVKKTSEKYDSLIDELKDIINSRVQSNDENKLESLKDSKEKLNESSEKIKESSKWSKKQDSSISTENSSPLSASKKSLKLDELSKNEDPSKNNDFLLDSEVFEEKSEMPIFSSKTFSSPQSKPNVTSNLLSVSGATQSQFRKSNSMDGGSSPSSTHSRKSVKLNNKVDVIMPNDDNDTEQDTASSLVMESDRSQYVTSNSRMASQMPTRTTPTFSSRLESSGIETEIENDLENERRPSRMTNRSSSKFNDSRYNSDVSPRQTRTIPNASSPRIGNSQLSDLIIDQEFESDNQDLISQRMSSGIITPPSGRSRRKSILKKSGYSSQTGTRATTNFDSRSKTSKTNNLIIEQESDVDEENSFDPNRPSILNTKRSSISSSRHYQSPSASHKRTRTNGISSSNSLGSDDILIDQEFVDEPEDQFDRSKQSHTISGRTARPSTRNSTGTSNLSLDTGNIVIEQEVVDESHDEDSLDQNGTSNQTNRGSTRFSSTKYDSDNSQHVSRTKTGITSSYLVSQNDSDHTSGSWSRTSEKPSRSSKLDKSKDSTQKQTETIPISQTTKISNSSRTDDILIDQEIEENVDNDEADNDRKASGLISKRSSVSSTRRKTRNTTNRTSPSDSLDGENIIIHQEIIEEDENDPNILETKSRLTSKRSSVPNIIIHQEILKEDEDDPSIGKTKSHLTSKRSTIPSTRRKTRTTTNRTSPSDSLDGKDIIIEQEILEDDSVIGKSQSRLGSKQSTVPSTRRRTRNTTHRTSLTDSLNGENVIIEDDDSTIGKTQSRFTSKRSTIPSTKRRTLTATNRTSNYDSLDGEKIIIGQEIIEENEDDPHIGKTQSHLTSKRFSIPSTGKRTRTTTNRTSSANSLDSEDILIEQEIVEEDENEDGPIIGKTQSHLTSQRSTIPSSRRRTGTKTNRTSTSSSLDSEDILNQQEIIEEDDPIILKIKDGSTSNQSTIQSTRKRTTHTAHRTSTSDSRDSQDIVINQEIIEEDDSIIGKTSSVVAVKGSSVPSTRRRTRTTTHRTSPSDSIDKEDTKIQQGIIEDAKEPIIEKSKSDSTIKRSSRSTQHKSKKSKTKSDDETIEKTKSSPISDNIIEQQIEEDSFITVSECLCANKFTGDPELNFLKKAVEHKISVASCRPKDKKSLEMQAEPDKYLMSIESIAERPVSSKLLSSCLSDIPSTNSITQKIEPSKIRSSILKKAHMQSNVEVRKSVRISNELPTFKKGFPLEKTALHHIINYTKPSDDFLVQRVSFAICDGEIMNNSIAHDVQVIRQSLSDEEDNLTESKNKIPSTSLVDDRKSASPMKDSDDSSTSDHFYTARTHFESQDSFKSIITCEWNKKNSLNTKLSRKEIERKRSEGKEVERKYSLKDYDRKKKKDEDRNIPRDIPSGSPKKKTVIKKRTRTEKTTLTKPTLVGEWSFESPKERESKGKKDKKKSSDGIENLREKSYESPKEKELKGKKELRKKDKKTPTNDKEDLREKSFESSKEEEPKRNKKLSKKERKTSKEGKEDIERKKLKRAKKPKDGQKGHIVKKMANITCAKTIQNSSGNLVKKENKFKSPVIFDFGENEDSLVSCFHMGTGVSIRISDPKVEIKPTKKKNKREKKPH